MKTEYVDITPTWLGLMPAFFSILENGSEEGKKEVREELLRLAKCVDQFNKKREGK